MLWIFWMGCTPAPSLATPPPPQGALVNIETSLGAFQVQLYESEAPLTTTNFLAYVDAGFYDGMDDGGATLIHRVVPDFVVQGGGLLEDRSDKPTMEEIQNEARDAQLSNVRGTLAMARTDRPNSATSQWFVNLVDNDFLDPGQGTNAGYAVFAMVMNGLDVVAAMSEVPAQNEFPEQPILIHSMQRAP